MSPFGASDSTRYDVDLTDGGPGDLDGLVNGTCETAIKFCRGESPLCPDAAITAVRARASGGVTETARRLAESRVATALERLMDAGATCDVARLVVAADARRDLGFRTRFATQLDDGRTVRRRSRVNVRCNPPSPDRPSDATCRSGRETCPPMTGPVCGNGIRDAAGETCDGADARACPGACTAACLCDAGPNAPAPVCGDGARNTSSERCDGADDALCPGACRGDCTCGTSDEFDVAPLAVVVASSSAVGSSPDNVVDRVVDGAPSNPVHEWVSDGETAGAWLRLTWMSPVTLDSVILYDRPNGLDNVTEGALLVDDDSEPIATGALAPDGAPTEVTFEERTVSSLTFMVTKASGTRSGLAEIQAVHARGKGRKTTTTTTTTSTTTTLRPTTTTTTLRPTTTTLRPTTTTTTTSTTRPPTTTTTSTKPPTTTTRTPTTQAPTTTSTTQPPAAGPTYYLSTTGSDSNSGTSPDRAWKTFNKAVKALYPGDTLVVADGKYTRGTSGMPVIDCGNGARSGTASKPITIRAANPRKAWLANNGVGEALFMKGCSYWNIVGFHASSADNTSAKEWEGNIMRFYQVGNVAIRGVLAVRPNRTCPNSSLSYCNSHGIAIDKSHHMLVEDCEVYDFHRHGVSAFNSRYVTVRRCYMNPWGATGGAGGGSTGVILYGSSDSIVENVVGEGVYGLNVAGGTVYDGTKGGYRNRLLGVVTLDAKHGSTIRARSFGGPVLPTGHNVVRDSVFIRAQNVGVFARGANDTLVENVSVFGTQVDAGIAADQDLSEGAPCSANPEGCSIVARNLLAVGNKGKGMKVVTSVMDDWALEDSNLYGNSGGNFPTSETAGDDSGYIRRSRSVAPGGMGTGSGQCMLWAPDGSNMRGAGAGGEDIGARVLYRYQDGVLTGERLWNRTTGAFPCGAVVAGVNDHPGRSCSGVHTRLNVNTNGCAFPSGY